ncbi:MAG: hypothetical protein ABW065_01510 [Solirubrobacterales bacterium]
MSFESKRLRIQIPCLDESKVEVATRTIRTCRTFDSIPYTFCRYPSDPQCGFRSSPITCIRNHTEWCWAGTCLHGSNCGTPTILNCFPRTLPGCADHTCPGGSEIDPDPKTMIEIEPDPTRPGAVLIRPEDLPRLRDHLQSELEGAERLQGEVREQLEEIESIESKLEEGEG